MITPIPGDGAPVTTAPIPLGDLTVIVDSLLKAAKVWDSEGVTTGSVATRCKGMELGGVEAGVFQGIVRPYDAVTQTVAARCQEGEQSMRDIATALIDNAKKYEAAEDASSSMALQAL